MALWRAAPPANPFSNLWWRPPPPLTDDKSHFWLQLGRPLTPCAGHDVHHHHLPQPACLARPGRQKPSCHFRSRRPCSDSTQLRWWYCRRLVGLFFDLEWEYWVIFESKLNYFECEDLKVSFLRHSIIIFFINYLKDDLSTLQKLLKRQAVRRP